MKKTILFATAMMVAVFANAQHVTPLDSITEFQLDSMRITYANNAAGLLMELQALQASVEADAQKLKDSEKQVKEETAYSKSLAKYAKAGISALSSLEKSYNSDITGLQKLRGVIDEELTTIHKLTTIKDDHIQKLEEDLNSQTSPIGERINNLQSELKNIAQRKAGLAEQQNALAIYDQEIQNKAASLKTMQAQVKLNKDAIKNELKVAKVAAKVQK